MNTAILIVGWFACGFAAWCACLADFYAIGTRYPILGTADEQWEEDGRDDARPLAVFIFLMGPIGLLAAAIASGFFRSGFRVW